jgi:citrate synthase
MFELGKLLGATNGFGNTAACSSQINYIHGDPGILRNRGFPVEQVAEHSTFAEVSYPLIYGMLAATAKWPGQYLQATSRPTCCRQHRR